jgi:hypothetical protein
MEILVSHATLFYPAVGTNQRLVCKERERERETERERGSLRKKARARSSRRIPLNI